MKEKSFLAIEGGNLLDVNRKELVENVTVLIQDSKIMNIGKKISIPQNYKIIDADGLTIMPGLIDTHLHFIGVTSGNPVDWIVEPNFLQAMRTISQAREVLDAGFTTVRSGGSRYDVYLKRMIEEKRVSGPTLLAAGLGIRRTGGHMYVRGDIYDLPEELIEKNHPMAMSCDGVEEIRKAVRKLINHGVDQIKVWVSGGSYWGKDRSGDVHFTLEEMKTLVDEAHMLRTRVMAHTENLRATKVAIAAGVDTIEHADDDEGKPGLDEEACNAMAEKNIILTPTLGVYFIGPWAVEVLPKNVLDSYKLAIETGVKFAVGSDSYTDSLTPFGKFSAMEIEKMVSVLGFSPMNAIVSATKIGAEALGMEEKIGILEKGKTADILLVKGNPIENIDVLLKRENIQFIIKEGRVSS